MAQISNIAHVVLRVSSVERAILFYRDVLGMEVVRHDKEGRMAFMSFGTQHHDIGLFQIKTESWPGVRGTLGLVHIALRVDGDLTDLKALHDKLVLNQADVHLTDHGMTKSVYFQDPDGNGLEIFIDSMTQEEGKKYLSERVGRGAGTFSFV